MLPLNNSSKLKTHVANKGVGKKETEEKKEFQKYSNQSLFKKIKERRMDVVLFV